LRDCDFGAFLRGLAAFASTRLVAAFFATFADFLDVLLAIAFTRRCLAMQLSGDGSVPGTLTYTAVQTVDVGHYGI
jgi:hypothetical protein